MSQFASSFAERPTATRDDVDGPSDVDRPSVAREVREESVLDGDSDDSYIITNDIIGNGGGSYVYDSENSEASEYSEDDEEYVPGPVQRRTTRQTAKKAASTKAAKTTAAQSNAVTTRKARATRSVSVR